MNDYVTITRRSSDDLTQWEWRFWFHNHTLWLDYYSESQRPTKRHGMKVTESYHRIAIRDHTTLKESDVVLPADLKAEAIKKFCETLEVKRWSERSI